MALGRNSRLQAISGTDIMTATTADAISARPASGPASSGLVLSLPRIWAFALPAISTAALGVMMGQFMPRYFAGHLGISLLAVGAALTSVRLVDTFIELPLGWLMDHTKTRIGRYRPWYLLGVPLLVAAVYMLFINARDHVTPQYLFVWYLVLSLGSSIMGLAHGAWAAQLASNYHQRSRVFGWMTCVGVTGAVALLALPKLTHGAIQPGKAESVHVIGWMIVLALPVLAALSAVVSPEPPTRNINRGKVVLSDYWKMISKPTALRLVAGDLILTLGPALTSPIYVFFFNQIKHFGIGDVTTLLIFYLGAPFVAAPLWARVAKKLGKHRTLQLGTVLYAICQTALMALPANVFWPSAIGMFCVGASNSAFGLMVRAMLADYSDQLRLEQGVQRVSLLYSFVGITLKLGTSLNFFITFSILNWVGFQASEDAVNTPRALFGLEMVYLFAPIVFVFIGGLFFFGYELDEKRHSEIRKALDERDAGMADAESLEATG
jgi:GPH family glycoside/pentoside/hexuronide:cation symporter